MSWKDKTLDPSNWNLSVNGFTTEMKHYIMEENINYLAISTKKTSMKENYMNVTYEGSLQEEHQELDKEVRHKTHSM